MPPVRDLVLSVKTCFGRTRTRSSEGSTSFRGRLGPITDPGETRMQNPAPLAQYAPYSPPVPTSEEQALSIALAQSVVDQQAWQAGRTNQQASSERSALQRSAAEAASQKFWQDGSLSYGEVVADGFYDIYGDFPEVCEGPNSFPALADLRKVRTGSGDVREVVLIDHEADHGLLAVEEQLSDAMADANPQDVAARVQVVAHVVCDRFGGAYDSESALDHFWHQSSSSEKRRNRSAVVLLCRLDVGSGRHRALLFKVLADAAKLQCRVIRGAALCGSDSAANVLVAVAGSEYVVDLVFEPGRLYTPEQFGALIKLRRARGDSWNSNPNAAAACVETSAASTSSASSAGTGTTPAGTNPGAAAPTASHNGSAGSGAGSLAAAANAAGTSTSAAGDTAAALPALSSPRTAQQRMAVTVPLVPAPGVYSSSVPTVAAGPLHGGPAAGGVWGTGIGVHAQQGTGPAIAGSRVRFTITDLPKAGSGAPPSMAAAVPTGAVVGSAPAARGGPLAGAGAGGRASAGVPPAACATSVSETGPSGSGGGGRHVMAALAPGKARSMLDLGVTGHHGHGSSSGGSGPGGDLIRLDSEPLPEHAHSAGLPQPEVCPTPTGGQHPHPHLSAAQAVHRTHGSLDQNGWVKFSGSFTRGGGGGGGRDESGVPALSRFGQQGGSANSVLAGGAAGNGAAHHHSHPSAPAALPQHQPPTQQQQQQPQPQQMESSGSLTSLCTAPSPDGASAAGGGPASAAASASGAAPAAPVPTGLSSASPFAHFMLPAGLSMSLPGGPAVGSGVGGGSSSAGPSLGGHGGSLPGTATQPQSTSQPGAHPQPVQPGQQPQQPRQGPHTTVSASPFQNMQLGFAAGMPPASMPSQLASSFPTLHPQHQLPLAAQPQQQPRLPSPPLPGQQQQGAVGAALPRVGSLTYAAPPPQVPQPATRQQAAASADATSGLRPFAGLAPGTVALSVTATTNALFTTPPKEATAGSKAPSPSLSTPFALTATSAQSTPPGSGPTVGGVFADLSPFNLGGGPGGNADGPTSASSAAAGLPGVAGSTAAMVGGSGGGGRGSRQGYRDGLPSATASEPDDRVRERAQTFFADLSPFNTGSGGGGGGPGGRENTPPGGHGRLGQQSPIVEMPSSDNSRDNTPRVSFTNFTEYPPGGGGPSSAGGMGGGDMSTLDMGRLRIASGRPDSSVGRMGSAHHGGQQLMQQPQQMHMQMQSAFATGAGQAQGPTPMGQAMGTGTGQGQAATAAQVLQQQLQQHQHQQMAVAYYKQAMQGGPYAVAYMQQAVAAATAAGMINMNPQQPQGYSMQPQFGGMGPAAGPGGPGLQWQHGYGPPPPPPPPQQQQLQLPMPQAPGPMPGQHPWAAPAWAAAPQQQQYQQQQQQFMMHSAFMQQMQQQQQQHQQHMMHGGGIGLGPGLPGQHSVERRMSMLATATTTTTTTVKTTHTVETAGATVTTGLPLQGGPQHALPSGGQQHRLQGGGGTDLAHEMTMPSVQRLAMLQAAVAAGSGSSGSGGHSSGGTAGDTGGLSSPLALQPTLSASMPLPPNYKDLEIEPEELTFGQRIGIGSYGEVYRGTWRGTEVAIKRFLEQNLHPATIRDFRDEVLIMSKLRHPNIVLFMGAVTSTNQLAIVTQYVQRGSLFRLLHRTKTELDPRRRLNIALDIAKGMEYLHNCKPVLVHRDLKSPNLLVDRDWTVKVCDFGLSKVKMDTFLTAKSQGGSPAWMAPEILRSERCDEKSDVFSFGVILYELVTGREPWESLNPMQVVGVVGFNGLRMELPTDLDPAVTALINSCWADKSTDRPSFSQVLATMTAWAELRPTEEVMTQQAAVVRARQQRMAAAAAASGNGHA